MKQDQIIDALNEINPEYIDEAAPRMNSHSRLRPWLALAACLALAVGVFAAARLARPAAEPELQQEESLPHEASEEALKEEPGEPSYPEPNADAQTILDYRIGGLYLGMPRQDVLDLYGEPTDQSKGGPMLLEDGSARETWWYKRSDDPAHLNDFEVQLADAGDGWVVNEIMVFTDCGLALPHGIRIGMTEEELLSVWPEIASETERLDSGAEVDENGVSHPIIGYQQFSRHLCFEVDLEDGVVYAVYLGRYFEDPMWEPDEPAPELPYDFSSGEITVWRRTDGGWESVQKTEQGAKMLETIFSIEDLVLLEQIPDEVSYVVDFRNGTVCLVCAPEEGITAGPNVPPDAWGAVYRLVDRDAFDASLAAGDAVPQGLTCLRQCVFPYGTWDALGEAFE